MSKKKKQITAEVGKHPPLPDEALEDILHLIRTTSTLYDSFVDGSLACNYNPSVNGFSLSEEQFHAIVNEAMTVFIKNNIKWFGSLDNEPIEEAFGFIGMFMQMNEGKLFTEDNIIYTLNAYIKNIDTKAINPMILIKENCDSYDSIGINHITNIDVIDPDATPMIQHSGSAIHGRILEFFIEHYESFLMRLISHDASNKTLRLILHPSLQVDVPWPSDFVKEHSELFLAPIFVQNPVAYTADYQKLIYGKLMEDYINLLREAVDPSIPKIVRDDEDILRSIIVHG